MDNKDLKNIEDLKVFNVFKVLKVPNSLTAFLLSFLLLSSAFSFNKIEAIREFDHAVAADAVPSVV